MSERLRERLRRDRPLATIRLRVPQDVLDELDRLAPALGYSGHPALIRAYVGQGLRRGLAAPGRDALDVVVEGLRRRGVDARVIADVIAEARARSG